MAKAPILHVVVGLPGAGKSTLIRSLSSMQELVVFDDYMKGVKKSEFIRGAPSLTDSPRYSELVSSLRAKRSVVVSDVMFCDSQVRLAFVELMRAEVVKFNFRWHFFENDLRAAAHNIRDRRRARWWQRELRLAGFLSRKYMIPEGVKPMKVLSK